MNTVYIPSGHKERVNDTKPIYYPCPTIFGTNNPLLWDQLTTDHVREGLAGRFLILTGRSGVRKRPADEIRQQTPPAKITDWVKRWGEFLHAADQPGGAGSPPPKIIPYTPVAAARLREHDDGIEDRLTVERGLRQAVWGRACERTQKLALIFAAARMLEHGDGADGAEISLADVDLAIAISNHATRELLYNLFDKVADNKFEADCKRVLQFVSTDPARPTLREKITRRFKWPARYRDEILQTLIEGGTLAAAHVKTGVGQRLFTGAFRARDR